MSVHFGKPEGVDGTVHLASSLTPRPRPAVRTSHHRVYVQLEGTDTWFFLSDPADLDTFVATGDESGES